jgi:hypothetical protein
LLFFILNFEKFQASTSWSELPEKVWLRVFQNLSMKDVNNVHLVCRNLHQIANLHVNPKLRFIKDSPKDLESLVQSSRVFEELKFYKGCTDYFSSHQKFATIEKYLGFIGIHVKMLTIGRMKVNPQIFQKFLSLLPNLESLELFNVESAGFELVPFKWDLKPSKIERIRLFGCTGLEGLLGSMENCAIQEVKLKDWPLDESRVMKKFLEAQKESLKKLVGRSCDFELANVKDLRLEHLEYSCSGSFIGFLEFLKQQVDLKYLSLNLREYTDEDFSVIFGLTNLESLTLDGDTESIEALHNIHKLHKLKRLAVGYMVSWNILDHLKFGVFNDLVELDAHFYSASVGSIREMKRITPNLKKLAIQSATSNTINAFLETLDTLESVKIQDDWNMSEKVCLNIKQLHVKTSGFKFNTDQFPKIFPNLEVLKIEALYLDVTESFFVKLLSGLKQLKTLCMRIWSRPGLARESALQCFEDHGKHLEDVNIIFVCEPKETTYAIEKKPGGAFCIKKKDKIDGAWIFQ